MFPKTWHESVLLVHSDELLVNVFERLTEDGFLGCPVVDVDNVYLNQVDILDILFYVCSLFKARQIEDPDQHPRSGSSAMHVTHCRPCVWCSVCC